MVVAAAEGPGAEIGEAAKLQPVKAQHIALYEISSLPAAPRIASLHRGRTGCWLAIVMSIYDREAIASEEAIFGRPICLTAVDRFWSFKPEQYSEHLRTSGAL